MQLLDFLKLVLPSQGVYCWVTIKNKKAKQGFVSTFELLRDKLLEEDAKGIDVYFACSSFLQSGNRKADNVKLTKAFWLDIDAGPGKPYKDAEAAAAALDLFCENAGIPYATVVCSGFGIHAWWPLDRELKPKEWKEYAEQFKRRTETNGLLADPIRTADLASILRAPGTRNFKRLEDIRNVSVWEFDNDKGAGNTLHSVESLFALPTQPLLQLHDTLDIVADWDKIKPKDETFSLTEGFPDGKRTEALVKRAGYLLGPAHSYSAEQTFAALVEWNKLNSPPLSDEKVLNTVMSIAKSERTRREAVSGNAISGLPVLPSGYKWSSNGRLTTQIPVKDTEEWETVELTEFPLYLLAVTRKEREFKQAYIFRQFVPKEGWREFQVSCAEFASSNCASAMADNGGYCVANAKLFKNYVHAADAELRRKQMDAIRYQQFGWKEDESAFLVGNSLIHAGGKIEQVYGAEEINFRMKQMLPHKGGSLNEWSADANLLFSDQYIHLGYALVASFATVLLKFCMGESDGGFVLSITSAGSGKGKTRIIEAATSVWGELESLQITPRDTINAQFAIVTVAGNLPIFMDEWNEKDPAILAKFLRQYTVGHDKNRAQRDGTVKSKPAEYKNLLIATSNHSIYEVMKLINDEGAMARVLEIVAPDMEGEVFKKFDKLTSRMLTNSGHAGREFIYQLMQPGMLEAVKKQLDTATNHFRDTLHTTGKHRYVTWLPAAVLVAGNLLVKAGILEFDLKRLMEWSFKQAQERVEDRTIVPATEVVSAFLTEHIGQILMVSGPYTPGYPSMVLNNMGAVPSKLVGRGERDSKRLYLIPSTFRLWCLRNGRDFPGIVKELEKEKVLLNRKRFTTLTAGTSVPSGRVPCWELNMEIPSMGGDIIPQSSGETLAQ